MPSRRIATFKEERGDPLLDVVNFLNEAALAYPAAISLAAGRPPDAGFTLEEHVTDLASSVRQMADARRESAAAVWQQLGEYGRTSGTINDILAAHLAIDEQIHIDPKGIVVTVGAQEAIAILLIGLFDPRRDVLLVSDPTYVGVTGLVRLLGIRVVPVPSGDSGLNPDDVEAAIMRASKIGRVRAIYDIPDFNNPLGTSLSVSDRIRLIEVCRRHGVFIIEDNPYGMFAYDHEPRPTLRALDGDGTVVYIGSFSKVLSPGLRVGYLVADQRNCSNGELLATSLSRVKSFLTVNTPPLSQAIAAGALIAAGGSLRSIVEPRRAACRSQRDAMLAALEHYCAGMSDEVSWNRPMGGFFMTLTLPYPFGLAELRRCAADYGVIVSPMRFFSLGNTRMRQVRLAFSYASSDQIWTGIERLMRYVRETCRASARPHERAASRRAHCTTA